MNRPVTAAIVAAVLALGAFVSIFIYVRNADIRALGGVEPKSVYVVVNPVSRGTVAEALATNIQLIQIPAKTVPDGAVVDLAEITQKVASVDLVKGEVLLTSRFVDPSVQSTDEVAVPKGMHQMSILVKAEQVRGGVIKAGETVGIFLTFKASGGQPYSIPGIGVIDGEIVTKLIMPKVLVTRVQGGVTVAADAKAGAAAGAPGGSVMLTLALNTADVEKLTWAQAAGSLMLTVENVDTNDSGSQYTNGRVVLR